jgi:hypothetical protein
VNLKPRRAEEPEINLISLIDVVLMMVIFFMVSSTFVDENRLRIRLPEASSAPHDALFREGSHHRDGHAGRRLPGQRPRARQRQSPRRCARRS